MTVGCGNEHIIARSNNQATIKAVNLYKYNSSLVCYCVNVIKPWLKSQPGRIESIENLKETRMLMKWKIKRPHWLIFCL